MVKVERGSIQIKVGGGYLSIDEFLDQYTPAELEKYERRDPLKRISEKIAVQKTVVDKGSREVSPVLVERPKPKSALKTHKSTASIKDMKKSILNTGRARQTQIEADKF